MRRVHLEVRGYMTTLSEDLELKDLARAKADIVKTRELEPDALRLPELCRDLYLARANGSTMLPHALTLRDREPGDASGHS